MAFEERGEDPQIGVAEGLAGFRIVREIVLAEKMRDDQDVELPGERNAGSGEGRAKGGLSCGLKGSEPCPARVKEGLIDIEEDQGVGKRLAGDAASFMVGMRLGRRERRGGSESHAMSVGDARRRGGI